MKKLFSLPSAALLQALAACGGGGSTGASGGGTSPTYSLALPSKLNTNPTLGATSFPIAISDYGIGTISFNQSTDTGGYGYQNAIYDAATSATFQYISNVHIDL